MGKGQIVQLRKLFVTFGTLYVLSQSLLLIASSFNGICCLVRVFLTPVRQRGLWRIGLRCCRNASVILVLLHERLVFRLLALVFGRCLYNIRQSGRIVDLLVGMHPDLLS